MAKRPHPIPLGVGEFLLEKAEWGRMLYDN